MPDKYGEDQDSYCYPDSDVLINLLSITDATTLSAAEVEFTRLRLEQYASPSFSNFSLATLKNIHHYLFQDLYKWAGELRTVDIRKGSTRFAHCDFIESRDGNGRAQRLLFECIAINAGYQLRWQEIDAERWGQVNAEAFFGRLESLIAQLSLAISQL